MAVSWEADASAPQAANTVRSSCDGQMSCDYNVNLGALGVPGGAPHRVTIAYDCNDGRTRYESAHWIEQTNVLRLSCFIQPTQYDSQVDRLGGSRFPLLPGFYRDNPNGRNIAALATPSTGSSPFGFIAQANAAYKSMMPIPNPYAELGAAIMNLLAKPQTKYYLPRLAAADGRILLQMDDGAWCHVRNPTAYSVVDTEWFFTPTSRDDAPKGTLPFCPMPDGFYKVPGNHGSAIYYLGNTAPGGRAPMEFYHVKFSSGYCLFTSPQNQKNLTAAVIGAQASDTAYAATVFSVGNDGDIAEGRKFLGNCRDDAVDPNAGGWSGTIPPPGWFSSPSSDVDHLRRILYLRGARTVNELNSMSSEDVRNTTIVEMKANSTQDINYYAAMDNHALAGIAGLQAYNQGSGANTQSMSADNIRNTTIAILVNRNRGSAQQFAAMDNYTLYRNTIL